MGFLQPLYCLFGKHHRSRGRAWTDGNAYRSWCTGCGKPMVRGFDGWHLDDQGEPAARDDMRA